MSSAVDLLELEHLLVVLVGSDDLVLGVENPPLTSAVVLRLKSRNLLRSVHLGKTGVGVPLRNRCRVNGENSVSVHARPDLERNVGLEASVEVSVEHKSGRSGNECKLH